MTQIASVMSTYSPCPFESTQATINNWHLGILVPVVPQVTRAQEGFAPLLCVEAEQKNLWNFISCPSLDNS